MTPHKVQCYEHNGEPYGRSYGNIHPDTFCPNNCLELPFPSGTIGKTYERDEVEVGYQSMYIDGYLSLDFKDCSFEQYKTAYMLFGSNTVQKIFRLIPQPVEKEPEIVEQELSSRQYIEQVYGTSTFARSIECKDAESLMDMMDDFLDWAMQKKQEASR